MENYHQLSKDGEKLKEFRQNLAQHFEIFMNIFLKLQYRRKQLIHQLLFIYPIERIAEKKYTINGIYLPNSDVLAGKIISTIIISRFKTKFNKSPARRTIVIRKIC